MITYVGLIKYKDGSLDLVTNKANDKFEARHYIQVEISTWKKLVEEIQVLPLHAIIEAFSHYSIARERIDTMSKKIVGIDLPYDTTMTDLHNAINILTERENGKQRNKS